MRKFIILAISLMALAIPTLALAGTTTVGGCTFTTNDKTNPLTVRKTTDSQEGPLRRAFL